MSGKLLAGGDPLPHNHDDDLPPVPTGQDGYTFNGREHLPKMVKLENAVARCTCGQLFVSRQCDDGWAGGVYWVPLRWWHRKAWAKLRVLEAARIGGVAP